MPLIIYPFIYLGLRLTIKGVVAIAIKNGVSTVTSQVVDRILKIFVNNTFVMALNVCVILGTVYLAGSSLDHGTSTLIISTVYFSSILYGLYSFTVNTPMIFTIVFTYKANLKKYIEAQIYRESYIRTKKEIDNLGPVKKFFNQLWGKSPHEIAVSISSKAIGLVIEKILVKSIWFSAAVAVYVFVFRLYVAPLLIKSSTGLTTMQALLWPFAYSADYFLGTTMALFVDNMK